MLNQNARKTHCKNGHELAGDNLYASSKQRPVAVGGAVTVAGPVGAALTVRDVLGRVVWSAAGTGKGAR